MRLRARGVAAVALIAGWAALAAACGTGRADGTGAARHASPGEAAFIDRSGLDVGPADFDWTIRTLDGEVVPFASFRGRVIFINVWASWCPPCVAELAGIERLRDALADTDVAFVLLSPEGPEPVERFLRAYGYRSLPVYLEHAPLPDAFGLEALPTTYIVDRSGAIVLRHRGAADWDRPEVGDFLRALAG